MISALPWELDIEDPSRIISADGNVIAKDYRFLDMDDFEAICRLINAHEHPGENYFRYVPLNDSQD